MRKIALLAAACASIATILAVPVAASASSAPQPPGGGSWDMIAVSSTGGATVYALVNGLSTDFVVCDTKADGHHAFGEVQIQLSDGSWQSEGRANEYSGNGFCTDSVAVTFVGPDYRA